jgi:hypothetical protein
MMTILRNRASIAQTMKEEAENKNGLRKHVPIAIVKEILRAQERGWDASRISKEYKVDPLVIQKLGKHIAIPVDNADGVVCSSTVDTEYRVFGHKSDGIINIRFRIPKQSKEGNISQLHILKILFLSPMLVHTESLQSVSKTTSPEAIYSIHQSNPSSDQSTN